MCDNLVHIKNLNKSLKVLRLVVVTQCLNTTMKLSTNLNFLFSLGLTLFILPAMVSAVPQNLVDDLGAENYELREKAEQDLAKWAKEKGQDSYEELSELKSKASSPEVKSRLENVMSGVIVYEAVPGTRGFMGISMQPRMGESFINTVTPESPAEKAGLKPSDVIIAIDGIDLAKKNKHLNEATDFIREYVKSKKEGEKLTVNINRNGKPMTIDIKLGNYDKYLKKGDQWEMGNGVIQIRPIPGGAGGGAGGFEILPGNGAKEFRLNLNLGQKAGKEPEIEKLEQLLKIREQLLGRADFPDELKDLLKRQNERKKMRIDKLRKEFELEEQKKGDKK